MFRLEKKAGKAILTIYGYVGGAFLDFRAVENALHEIKNDGYRQIDLWLHTYGGDVFEGNLIDNFISDFAKTGEVDLYMPGVMASMGSIIMTAATRRHIADNGFVMVHSPRGGGFGTAKEHLQTAKLLNSIEKTFAARLTALTGKPENEVRKWFDGTDYWFDADECIELGLCDDKFSPKVKDIGLLDKEQLIQLGAKGIFEKFSALTIQKPLNKTEMDKKSLIARYGLTTVTEANTDEEVMAAIDAKINAEKTKAKEAQDKLDLSNKAAIKAAVKAAVDAGKISADKSAEYEARGEKIGIDELNAIFTDMQVYETITDKLDGKGSKPASGRKDWDWDKWQEEAAKSEEVKAEFEAMPRKDKDAFKALYKAKFKSEPEL